MPAYEFPESVDTKIKGFHQSLEKVQAEIIKYSVKQQEPLFAERDAIVKEVPGFWIKALQNCAAVATFIDDADIVVLQHLTNLRVERNLADPREVTAHFDFAENDYFTNKTLTKEFKVKEDALALGSDEYDFADSVKSSKVTIDWKSEEKNLTKKYPSNMGAGEDEDDEDALANITPGSIFASFFESEDDTFPARIGDNIVNEFYPRAHDYFLDIVEDDYDYDSDDIEFDSEDEELDEEDEDDDDNEIDLEAEEAGRPSKKAKAA